MGDREPTAAEAVARAGAVEPSAAAPSAAAPSQGEPAEAAVLPRRRTPAERLLDRIGHRGFARPRVAVSRRIFEKYRVQDPWDPDAGPEDPIALGPVGLELGKRLAVARHLRPPERKGKGKGRRQHKAHDPHAFQPRGVPQAKAPARPRSTQEPPPREVAPAADAAPIIARTAFGDRVDKQPLRQRIPVRPDLARPDDGAVADNAAGAAEQRSVPRPSRPKASGTKGRAGRFRMASAKATTSPVVREIRPDPEPVAEPPPAEPAPPPRRAMPPSGDSLDDLFGMASMGDRIRLGGRRRGTEATDEDGED